MNFKYCYFSQILRIDPSVDSKVLKEFKQAINGKNTYKDGKIFDLRKIKEPPVELLKRKYVDTIATSTKARNTSAELIKKYNVDNIVDWYECNWFNMENNILKAKWLDEYTLFFTSTTHAIQLLRYFYLEYGLKMYYSFVKKGSTYFENNCGFVIYGDKIDNKTIPVDNLKKFVFGSILLHNKPLSFKKWEKITIKGNPKKYYYENFIEHNAEIRLQNAFKSDASIILIANLMVNKKMSPETIWKKISVFL